MQSLVEQSLKFSGELKATVSNMFHHEQNHND